MTKLIEATSRRLYYGSIKLVPVNDRDEFPYNLPQNADKWHVPGRKLATTADLVKRATSRGITVVLAEQSGARVVSTRLN